MIMGKIKHFGFQKTHLSEDVPFSEEFLKVLLQNHAPIVKLF